MKKRMTIQTPDGAERNIYAQLAILGKVLKQARKERKLTQKDIAAFMHTSQSEISRIENGEVNYSILKIIEYSMALEGATIQLTSKPSYPPRNVHRTESHFVILQDYAGRNKVVTETKAVITTAKKKGYTEEEIEWIDEFSSSELQDNHKA